MKTLYLTKSGGSTDLSAYSTTAEANALYAPITRAGENLIINGAMQVWQRGTSFAGVTTDTYSADRWMWSPSTDATVTLTQETVSTSAVFSKYLMMDVTTADASIATGQYAGFVYFMEGADCFDLRLGTSDAATVTLSFWHAHTKTGTHSGSLRNSANDRSYVFEYTQSVANTWEKAEITIDLDTTGTWLIGNNVGLKLHLAAAVGATYATTAGSWAAGNYRGSSNQVNNLDSISNFMRFGNIKLEMGSTATDMVARNYVEELARCKRYWQKINGGQDNIGSGSMQASTTCYLTVSLPVQLRATPTLTVTPGDMRLREGSNLTPSAITVRDTGTDGVVLDVTVTGGTQYATGSMRDTGTDGIEFDSELG